MNVNVKEKVWGVLDWPSQCPDLNQAKWMVMSMGHKLAAVFAFKGHMHFIALIYFQDNP